MKNALILILLIALSSYALADVTVTVDGGVSGITSNSVIDIEHDSTSIWIGTGGGASVTTDDGASWTTFGAETLPSDEVSALAVNDRGAWVGNSHSQAAAGENFPYGDGISLSRNGGLTWDSFFPEQVRFFGKLSYDLAIYDSVAYSACFYGGLIRSTDFGATWQNLFPTQLDSINTDSLDYHNQSAPYQSLSNRFFAVRTDTTAFPETLSVWGGTAAGIYRFMFYADTLTGAIHTYPDSIENYRYILGDTSVVDSLKLPGNHVVALGVNMVDSVKYIWAACRPVYSGEARRVAYSTDNGAIWHTANIVDPTGYPHIEGWDFSFAGETTYVATGFGLYRSNGDYSSWTRLSGFRDPERQTFYQDDAPFYSVDVVDGAVWAGGADGVVKSVPGGWQVYRTQRDATEHYAYPSPFSPALSVRKGTTIHFLPASNTEATIKIYDFNLELVKTVAENLPRTGGIESDDVIWDGTNGKGEYVANGIYFYRIELGSGEDLWGKVVVIK